MESKKSSQSGADEQVQAYVDRMQALIFPAFGLEDLLYAYIALLVMQNSIQPLLPPGAEDFVQPIASRFQAQIEGED